MATAMSAVWLALALAGGPAPTEEAAAPPAQALELAPVPMPASVEEALGVERASVWRKLGIGGLVTGGALAVVSVSAFTLGFDAERELRQEPHPRAEVDALLFRRGVAAALAWPSGVIGALTLGFGVTCLVLDDSAAAGSADAGSAEPPLSDGNEEVTP